MCIAWCDARWQLTGASDLSDNQVWDVATEARACRCGGRCDEPRQNERGRAGLSGRPRWVGLSKVADPSDQTRCQLTNAKCEGDSQQPHADEDGSHRVVGVCHWSVSAWDTTDNAGGANATASRVTATCSGTARDQRVRRTIVICGSRSRRFRGLAIPMASVISACHTEKTKPIVAKSNPAAVSRSADTVIKVSRLLVPGGSSSRSRKHLRCPRPS
jgi:hypothetical protein